MGLDAGPQERKSWKLELRKATKGIQDQAYNIILILKLNNAKVKNNLID